MFKGYIANTTTRRVDYGKRLNLQENVSDDKGHGNQMECPVQITDLAGNKF